MVKKYIAVTALSIGCFATTALAEVTCQNISDGTPLQVCNSQPAVDCKNDIPTSKVLDAVGLDESSPLNCTMEDLQKQTPSSDVDEVKKIYNKQCRQKAKEYKKAVLKHLLKEFKLGQAMQVLLKKKKYSAKFKDGRPSAVTTQADFSKNLENLTSEQLNKLLIEDLEKRFPGLSEMALQLQKKPGFQYGFHEDETVPVKIAVKTQKGKSCLVRTDDLPQPKPFSPEPCEFCMSKDIKDSFVDDCSYMTSSSYSEGQAQKLLGINEETKTKYCQPDMSKQNSDMAEIDAMKKRLCNIAQNKMAPDFTIETTRNLYNDKTQNLAQKRGEFIQKYLRDGLLKDCPLDETPSWLQDEKEFSERIKVVHPQYVGNSKDGDYGPNPYAVASEQEGEIEKLSKTLDFEKMALEGKKVSAEKELVIIQTEKEKKLKLIESAKETYTKNQKEFSKLTDLKIIKEKYEALAALSHSVQSLYSDLDQLRQKESDIGSEIKGYSQSLTKYSPEQITQKVSLLKDFYKEKNVNPNFSKEEWDKKLFNSFKMVRISGRAEDEKSVPIASDDAVSPQLNIMLNTLVEVDKYTCVVDPITTKKGTLKGALRGLAKIGLVVASPVVAAGALVGTVALSPITTTASLLCFGCSTPGEVLPKWMAIGNLTQLNLSRSSRSDFKGELKGYWNSYLDLAAEPYWERQKREITHDKKEMAKEYYKDQYADKTAP